MTAVPGVGGLPELGGVFGADDPEPEEPPAGEDEDVPCLAPVSCWAKGSLLAKRLKEASWPSWSDGAGVAPVVSVAAVGPAGAGDAPWRVGAARLGVVPVVGGGVVDVAPVAELADATGVA